LEGIEILDVLVFKNVLDILERVGIDVLADILKDVLADVLVFKNVLDILEGIEILDIFAGMFNDVVFDRV